MHVLVVLAHPEPRSFNAQMKDVAVESFRAQGHGVEVSDLYAQGFDAAEGPAHYPSRADPEWFRAQVEQRHAGEHGTLAPAVVTEIERLERADVVLFQFPMWWFSMPAMLKGWLDRVLVYGEVYTSRVRYDVGRFKGRRAMLSVSTGAPEPTHAHNGRNADIEMLLWPMHYALYYVGFTLLPPFVATGIEGGVQYSGADAVAKRIEGHKRAFAERLRALDEARPLAFNGVADYDDEGRLKPGVEGHSPFIRAAR